MKIHVYDSDIIFLYHNYQKNKMPAWGPNIASKRKRKSREKRIGQNKINRRVDVFKLPDVTDWLTWLTCRLDNQKYFCFGWADGR